jgi:D-amino-acid dehydrogenase
MDLPAPDIAKTWYGYRPVSPDGMPYIGRHTQYDNLCYAGGHAMLGVSAAAGTGVLIEQLIGRKKTGIDISAFNPERFSH